jgi:hypothetical protein
MCTHVLLSCRAGNLIIMRLWFGWEEKINSPFLSVEGGGEGDGGVMDSLVSSALSNINKL